MHQEESLALSREIGDANFITWNLHNLAGLAIQQEDPQRAWPLVEEAFVRAQDSGDELALLVCLAILAQAASLLEQPAAAGVLWGAATRLDQELGDTLWRHGREQIEASLGEPTPEFDEGVARGRLLTPADALVAAALGV